jgi:PAS domain S-box-containing protein
MPTEIRVLHVDDEPDFADLSSTFLEQEDDRFTVETAYNSSEGLDRLDSTIHCVVSDYDMPGTNGIEFLEQVRQEFPELPFILFTGKGSEEIASDAISADVTDYLQKSSEKEQFTILANRILNAVEKYRTEQRLERQNDLFNKAQDIAEVGAWEHDLRTEELVWTDKVYEMHGVSSSFDLSVESVFEFYHPDDRPQLRAAIDRATQEGEPYDLEVRMTPADGGQRWIRTAADPQMEDGQIVRVRGTVRDITARKEREEQLERERKRFSALFENFPEPTFTYEFVDGEPVIRAINDAFEETFGYTEEEACGSHVDELIVPPEKEREAERIDSRVQEGEYVDEIVRRRTSEDDRYFNFRNIQVPFESGVDGFAVYLDVTDKFERERKVEELQDATRDLMTARTEDDIAEIAVETAIDVLDLPLSSVFTVDEQGESLSALYTTAQVESVFDSVPEYGSDSGKQIDRVTWEIFEDGELRVFQDVEQETSLDERPIRSAILAPIGEHGLFISSSLERAAFDSIDVGVVDILVKNVEAAFERRVYERELERTNERLDEFASLISHDLRNPLNTLELSLDMAHRTGADEHFERCERSVDRMNELLEDLLTLTRRADRIDSRESMALATVVENVWETVETGQATLSVETNLTLTADRGRLKQLLENLFRNSVEHAGPDVSVSVGDLEDGFYVSDDGPGIPDDGRDEIFDTGYSTSEAGTGLGLAIVEEIVDAHDWTITVSESPEGGARFEIADIVTVE